MIAVAAGLAALAVVVLLSRDNGRLAIVVSPPRHDPGRGASPPGSTPQVGSRPTRLSPATAACLLLGISVAVVVTAPVGPVLGLAVAVGGPRVLTRLEPGAVREQRAQLLADLPLLLDLLASCLAGGAPLAAAAEAVGRAVPGPGGARLLAVSTALTVGMPAAEAWAVLASPTAGEQPGPAATDPVLGHPGRGGRSPDEEDPLAPAARALARAAEGGAPVAAAVARLAVEARAEARSRGEQAARRVGVLAVAPLGLCFLPAFVLIGIVPVVAGLVGPLLGTLS